MALLGAGEGRFFPKWDLLSGAPVLELGSTRCFPALSPSPKNIPAALSGRGGRAASVFFSLSEQDQEVIGYLGGDLGKVISSYTF